MTKEKNVVNDVVQKNVRADAPPRVPHYEEIPQVPQPVEPINEGQQPQHYAAPQPSHVDPRNAHLNQMVTQHPQFKGNYYQVQSRGFPTEPGMDWRHLTREQRAQWMREHENRWKERANRNAGGDMHPNLSWTRGHGNSNG